MEEGRVIYCDGGSPITKNFECYQSFYYFHLFAAIVGITILTVFALICGLFYIDTNIYSNIPFASPPSKIGIQKRIVKVFMVLYYTVLFNGTIGQFFICAVCFMFCMILFLRSKDAPHYNYSVFKVIVLQESTLVWIGIYGVICALFSN